MVEFGLEHSGRHGDGSGDCGGMAMAEHPKTAKARKAIGKVSSLEYTLHCVQAQVDAAKREAAAALREMREAGVPDEPWAKHWRECVVLE